MQQKGTKLLTLAIAGAFVLPSTSHAGGVTYQDGDKYLKVGGRLQLQYYQERPDGGETTDDLFFRRL